MKNLAYFSGFALASMLVSLTMAILLEMEIHTHSLTYAKDVMGLNYLTEADL